MSSELTLFDTDTFAERSSDLATEEEHLLLCQHVINIDRLSHGAGAVPETFRFVGPTPATALEPFEFDKQYAIKLLPAGRLGIGALRSVRAADKREVQVIVTCELFAVPVMINFPRYLVDDDFVQSSPVVAVLLKTPSWHYKMPWGIHGSSTPTDIHARSFPAPPEIEYVSIIASVQTTSAKPGVEPPTMVLSWTSCKLRYDMYLEIRYIDKNAILRGRILGVRAIEVAWIELVVIVHPHYAWMTSTDFLYLTVPYTHVTLGEAVHRQVVAHADALPRLLLSCGLRRPLPITPQS